MHEKIPTEPPVGINKPKHMQPDNYALFNIIELIELPASTAFLKAGSSLYIPYTNILM